MKRFFAVLIALLIVTAAAAPASLAKDCWYYAANGTHDFEQTDFGYATCTDWGYYVIECRQCGYNEMVYTDAPYGHDWQVIQNTAPTCEKDGVKKYECQECYQTKTDTLKATGHNWKKGEVLESPTCTSEGSQRVICTVCGSKSYITLEKTAHTYGSWTVTTPATASSMGTRSRSCTVCGKTETGSFYPDGTLYRGCDGKSAVKNLQQMLIDLGILNDKADGVFGKKTEQAVKDFQKSAGYDVTGIAYPQTQTGIEAEWNKKMATPKPTATPKVTATSKPAITRRPSVPAAPTAPIVTQKPAMTQTPDEIEFPPFCEHELDEEGNDVVTWCETHDGVWKACDVLLETARTDAAKAETWKSIRALWRAELDGLFEAWTALADEETLPSVINAKAMFFVYLQMQENMVKAQSVEAWAGDEAAVNLMSIQCADICEALYALDENNIGE